MAQVKAHMIGNMSRWSFSEMTANDNGKTSATSTMGATIIIIGCIAFLLGAIDRIFFSHSIDIMTQTIVFTGIGASLLGVNKWATKDMVVDPTLSTKLVEKPAETPVVTPPVDTPENP